MNKSYLLSPEYELLRVAAIINADTNRLLHIRQLAEQVVNWNTVVAESEIEGLSPILYKHLQSCEFPLTTDLRQKLRALTVRHRHATTTRIKQCVHISDLLNEANIPSLALKGIALANVLYPRPELRPMRDIDLLVPLQNSKQAQSIIANNGYQFEATQPSRFMRRHHHLPNATKTVDDMLVSLELHTNAISGDAPGSMQYNQLFELPNDITTEYGNLKILAPIDMLNQLCRHALEPGNKIKLGSIMDIVGFASRYFDNINWTILGKMYPYIPVFIGLIHYVSPLPDNLYHLFSNQNKPLQVGELIPTLSSLRSKKLSTSEIIKCLSSPPQWWFQSYYGVSKTTRSKLSATLEHRLRVISWITRRLFAALPLQ